MSVLESCPAAAAPDGCGIGVAIPPAAYAPTRTVDPGGRRWLVLRPRPGLALCRELALRPRFAVTTFALGFGETPQTARLRTLDRCPR